MESGFLYDPANASLIAGLILLGLDIVVIGLSPVMFIAVGALLTSAALYATGWRPSLVETAAIVAGSSLLIAIVGRKPLQQFQNADIEEDKSSDLIGRDVTMTHEVTKTHGVVFWSGCGSVFFLVKPLINLLSSSFLNISYFMLSTFKSRSFENPILNLFSFEHLHTSLFKSIPHL